MASRYSDIKRGGELNAALTNYTTYLSNASSRQTKRQKGGTYAPKARTKQLIYIKPFGTVTDTNEYLEIKTSAQALDSTKGSGSTIINGSTDNYGVATKPGSAVIVLPPKGYMPAKAIVFRRNATAPTYQQSKVTKLYYIKYPGESYGIPFGKKLSGTANAEGDAYTDVKNRLFTAVSSSAGSRVSIKDEVLSNGF